MWVTLEEYFEKKINIKYLSCIRAYLALDTSIQYSFMSRSEVGGEPVRTTCEYQWEVLTILNNPPPLCLCVDVNKHKSQRERNKRNHNICYPPSKTHIFHLFYRIRFLRLFIKISSTETLHLTCFLLTKAHVFCIFVVI